MLIPEFIFLLVMLYIGTRYGGIGLGVISGIGLLIEVFILRMPPASPPVQVMLIIIAVVCCAAILEAAGGLKYMLQIAERFLRKNPCLLVAILLLKTKFALKDQWQQPLYPHN